MQAIRWFVLGALWLAQAARAQDAKPLPFTVTVYDQLLRPVPDAEVTVKDGDGAVVASGRSDAGGRWSTPARDGWLTCEASIEGMTSARSGLSQNVSFFGRRDVALHLVPAVTLRGRVLDDRGEPVPRAAVSVSWRRASGGLPDVVLPEVTCDGSGQFTLTGVPVSDVVLSAWAPGHVLGTSAVRAREHAMCDVVCKHGVGREVQVHLEGPVSRLADPPVVQLTVMHADGAIRELPLPLRETPIDADGRAVLRGLPENATRVVLSVRAASAGVDVTPRWANGSVAADEPVRFRIGPEARVQAVRGSLHDAEGRALSGLPVRVGLAGDDGRLATTDERGRFQVEVAIREGQALFVSVPDSPWVLVEPDPRRRRAFRAPRNKFEPGGELKLVGVREAVVRGTLRMQDGRTPAGMAIGFVGGGPFARGPRCEVADDGAFELRGFAPLAGAFTLAVDELNGWARVGPLSFADGREVDDVEVVIGPPAEVHGVVRDRSGDPVVGAWVELAAARSGPSGSLDRSRATLTDRDGRYVLRGSPPGTYDLSILRGDSSTKLEGVELIQGERRERDVTLKP